MSYVGFKTLEIALKDAVMPLEIKLNIATGELEEVKVTYSTGYQNIPKERATGSFVQIDNELFNRRVGATVLGRIDDLVPGLLNKKISGNVSSNSLDNYVIRGESTINANKRPLLVVDNFVYEGDPDKLNPNNVESITVLKDAAAASIWGARAGNGVIVITTKKGKMNSGPTIDFNTNVTLKEKPDLLSLPSIPSKDIIALERTRFADSLLNTYDVLYPPAKVFPMLSPATEILLASRKGKLTKTEAERQLALLESHDVRNDINRYLLQNGVAQQYALSISGGANNYQYRGYVGYDRNRANDINIKDDRLSLGFNNTWTPLKNLQVNTQLNWGQSKNGDRNSLGGYSVLLNNPYQRLADENGNPLSIPKGYRLTYVDTVSFPGQLDWHYRPLDEARNGNRNSSGYNTNIITNVDYTIINGLKINFGYNWGKQTNENTNVQGINTFYTRNLINQYLTKDQNGSPVYPYPLGGIYDQSNSDNTFWSIRGQLNFNRSFGLHQFSSLTGVERSESSAKLIRIPIQYGYSAETNVFNVPLIGNWPTRPQGRINAIAPPGSVQLGGTLNRFGSYYGNFGYTYNQKYTFIASGRIDESNYFGVEANARKKPLWSAGLVWNIANENFYGIEAMPVLNLRTTYGYSGNTNPGVSPLATAAYFNGSPPTNLPDAIIGQAPNPELRWEQVRTINLAIDFGTKNQRIGGSLDFYHKKATHLISKVVVDPTSGFIEYNGNSSSLQVRGLDMSLNTKNINGIFKWYSNINFALQKDKIISYTVDPPKVPVTLTGTTGVYFLGKPKNSLYSYRWAGLNPLNGDAQAYVGDQTVGSTAFRNKAVQADLAYSGQTNPPVFGSFRNDFSYKNISLSLGINFQLDHYFRRSSFDGIIGGKANENIPLSGHEDYLKAWKSPGDELTTNVPGFIDLFYEDQRYLVYQAADILIEKGDQIRLQDIRFSYSLNKYRFKGLPFKNTSFYVYANNLGFIWKASKYNPDTQDGVSTIPIQRTIALGFNATF